MDVLHNSQNNIDNPDVIQKIIFLISFVNNLADNILLILNAHCAESNDVVNNVNLLEELLNSRLHINQVGELVERCKSLIDFIYEYINIF